MTRDDREPPAPRADSGRAGGPDRADPGDDALDPGDDALDPALRAALERWQPAGAPDGFAARVTAAAVAGAAPVARARPRRPWMVAGAVAAVAAGAAAVVAVAPWSPSPSPAPSPGAVAARTFAVRETVGLADRGVAVAEAGARLGWRRDGRSLAVVQDDGDVFYRVDPAPAGRAAPFVVTTPAGSIEVTGTCFRVEIITMRPARSAVLGAAAGAVLATAAVVTVYEGKVLVAGPAGKAEVAAGQQVTLDGTAPAPGPGSLAARAPTVAFAVPEAPASTITREEILARDRAQREQIAALGARLQELEGARAGARGGRRPGPPSDDEVDWIDPGPDELLALARECGVNLDIPPVMRGDPMQIDPATAQAAGLTADEHAAANQVFVELARSWKQRVRGWYVDATGDHQGADQLSAHAMGEELHDKAAPGEPELVRRRISQERAGLAPAPADVQRLSPFERYFRALAGLGEEAERLLAARVGADKARAVRAEHGGWPMRMSMSGCADGGADDAEAAR
ncbi:MAG: hypothetical protein KJZ91_04425 [Myxococcales bacterium]|nr:hypothetical protein [Myxococcales bacterium]